MVLVTGQLVLGGRAVWEQRCSSMGGRWSVSGGMARDALSPSTHSNCSSIWPSWPPGPCRRDMYSHAHISAYIHSQFYRTIYTVNFRLIVQKCCINIILWMRFIKRQGLDWLATHLTNVWFSHLLALFPGAGLGMRLVTCRTSHSCPGLIPIPTNETS